MFGCQGITWTSASQQLPGAIREEFGSSQASLSAHMEHPLEGIWLWTGLVLAQTVKEVWTIS